MLLSAVPPAGVEADRHLLDARAERRHLRQDLRLAGEAALADQLVAVRSNAARSAAAR